MYRKAFLVMSLLIISAGITFAQKSISGFVKTITGEPVAGAFASIEQQREGSSKNGAISLADGSFTITDVPQGATTLTASCLGMKTVSVNITSSPMNIIMEDDALALDQVVVTAQGLTRKEKSLGYSTVQIKGEDLSMSRQTDITQSLAGKVAGARFFSSSGATFSEGTIVLRGTSSYTSRAGSEPIYVVDGTITNKNAVNMDDIANVNILKGPGATALYGSQGGNGAVIITTKPAKGSDSRIEVSHTIAMETYYNHFQHQKLYGGGSLGRDGAREGNDASVTEDTMSAAYLFGKYAGMNEDGSYYMDYGSDENWGPRFDESTLVANALYYDETSPWYIKPSLGNSASTFMTSTGQDGRIPRTWHSQRQADLERHIRRGQAWGGNCRIHRAEGLRLRSPFRQLFQRTIHQRLFQPQQFFRLGGGHQLYHQIQNQKRFRKRHRFIRRHLLPGFVAEERLGFKASFKQEQLPLRRRVRQRDAKPVH